MEASGLLNQRLWDQMYRLYTADISRRIEADDGANKAINVELTNNTTSTLRVIAIVLYEKEVEIDTAMGQIVQGV